MSLICEDLRKIKNRKGKIFIKDVDKYIRRGLVAGDHSRPYLTDMGDSFLENPEKFEAMEELRSI